MSRDDFINGLKPPENKKLMDDSFLYGDFRKYKKIEATFPPPPQKQVYTSNIPVENKSGKKGKRRLLKIISLIGLSGFTAFGSIAMVVDSNKPASLDEILAIETPKSLGISENTQETLTELRSRTNKNLNREEKIELAGDIIDFEKDIIKSKIIYAFDILGKPIDKSDISLIPEQVGKHNVQIVIDGIGTYEYEEKEEGKEPKYTISEDIANYITDIVKMQGNKSDLEVGIEQDNSRQNAKESLDNTDTFAAGKIEVDENGNITIKMKTKAELAREKMDREAEDDEYDR